MKLKDEFIKNLVSEKFKIDEIEGLIVFKTIKDSYLIINEGLKKFLEKEKSLKFKFSKKLIIKNGEIFLTIKLIKENLTENEITKVINSIKYEDLFKLKDLIERYAFLIIIKNLIIEDDDSHKEIISGFKKYGFNIEEINYIRPHGSTLLDIIDEYIFKYKIIFVYYEEGLEYYLKRILKDCGYSKKIDLKKDSFIFLRKNSIVTIFKKRKYYKMIKEILKEVT